ncbi:acyl-CoA dehydrogenase family protein [Crateriforma spongiae]|uniref:acyl-CoA dehydrogenase family protein n=1 Tax=Crateriforma spongiae TaxID=2724528 RepID=UPI0014482912|nr:acyl-CoA dehydrogenase family protein [Crateriforma spongiae]
MTSPPVITRLSDPEFGSLCDDLAAQASLWNAPEHWPGGPIHQCAASGALRWTLSSDHGGVDWPPDRQLLAYLRLAQADLTTTFVLTQYAGACRRIAGSENAAVRAQHLEALLSGDRFGTVGISHLTTSRRHLDRPILSARQTDEGGLILSGVAPWVTGAAHAEVIVLGAKLDDGREALVAVPTDLPGVHCGPGVSMIALSASCTDMVRLDDVVVSPSMIVAGPVEDVMKTGSGGGTGGLQTSALALGLAAAAIDFLADESVARPDLAPIADQLQRECDAQLDNLLAAANPPGEDQHLQPETKIPSDPMAIRGRANDLVMRCTQAAMTAAKGAGFVEGHPVGRWCREALFFLVWSCPQPIAQNHLYNLAGVSGDTAG